MNKILYFPSIELPPTDWTKQAILYWDEIGIIAPEMYKNRLSPNMELLIKENIVKINYPSLFPGFSEGFFEYAQEFAEGNRDAAEDYTLKSGHLLHFSKLQHIGPELVSLNLAREGLDPEWYQVHPHIASTFMTALAFSISNDKNYHPVTDRLYYSSPLNNESMKDLNDSYFPILEENEIVRKLLITSLPTPQHLTIEELIAFKYQHQDALQRYQDKIKSEARIIQAKLESGKSIDVLIDRFRAETSDALKQLEEVLDSNYEYKMSACANVIAQLPGMLVEPFTNSISFIISLSQVRSKRKVTSPFLYSALLNKNI